MFTALFVFTALGFFLGWAQGRTAFANECIITGNFTVHDYRLNRERRFTCEEAPLESKDEADQTSARSKRSLQALQRVCQEHYDCGSVDFKIATVARLGANRGVPSAQTIRNKTGYHYRALLDAWQKLGESEKLSAKGILHPRENTIGLK